MQKNKNNFIQGHYLLIMILKKCSKLGKMGNSSYVFSHFSFAISIKKINKDIEQQSPEVFFSSIKPSAEIHIGKYLGCLKFWKELQLKSNQSSYFYMIADQNALGQLALPRPESQIDSKIDKNTLSTLALILATGVNPKKAAIFLESSLPTIYELMWLFTCITSLESLKNSTLFPSEKPSTMACEFLSPIIEASSIILSGASNVIVGENKLLSVKFASSLANKINELANIELTSQPKPWICEQSKILNLHFTSERMSSNEAVTKNKIHMLDSEETIRAKIMKAKTDTNSTIDSNPSRLEVQNLLNLFCGFSGMTKSESDKHCNGMTFESFKKNLAELIAEKLEPIQTEFSHLITETAYLNEVLQLGKWKALEKSHETIVKIKNGIKYFSN